MARGLNKVMIIGNLGKDPEMKYKNSGASLKPSVSMREAFLAF